MSKLKDDQCAFAMALGKLLVWIGRQKGYSVSLGDAESKIDNKPQHSPNSFHYKRLAIDLNLFIDGKYQRSTKAHARMGAYWKKIGGSWGGDFTKPDGNHYSWGEGS
jgi:hypothetical protein